MITSYTKHRYLKASSPLLNILIILACALIAPAGLLVGLELHKYADNMLGRKIVPVACEVQCI